MLNGGLHLNLDGAWPNELLGLPQLNASEWGPKLRFTAPRRLIEDFYREIQPQLASFIIYGSGDFHHLTGLMVRRVNEPVVIVSFDNHPDWDIRPPKWCCGGWLNRALELPQIKKVSVWGCGNFECWWPGQIFGNRRAEREGRIEVHPWSDDRRPQDRQRRGAILRDHWRENFEVFAGNLGGASIYVTIDMDCLRAGDAVTNWENGRFSTADVVWALAELRKHSRIVAGDICGAFSNPRYARWKQKFASEMDHPKLPAQSPDETRRINLAAAETLWPALIGTSS